LLETQGLRRSARALLVNAPKALHLFMCPEIGNPRRIQKFDAQSKGNQKRTSVARSLLQQGSQRTINLEPAVVTDEAQLAEFVHEEIDARSRGADHIGQRVLADAL